MEQQLLSLLHHYGYEAVLVAIAGESMGLPLPGETMLITASIYAGTTHNLNIGLVILFAVIGAVVGDNLGYEIGRVGGYRLLHRFGKYVRLEEKHLKLGKYLFYKYGARVVFFGRFITVLRTWAAFLAGVNKMHWKKFLLFNALGALLWGDFYGLLGYFFGRELIQYTGLLRYILLNLGVLILIGSVVFTQYHMKRFEAEAEKMYPNS
jgi:membrane protein DedA with SNARE-associated domain